MPVRPNPANVASDAVCGLTITKTITAPIPEDNSISPKILNGVFIFAPIAVRTEKGVCPFKRFKT